MPRGSRGIYLLHIPCPYHHHHPDINVNTLQFGAKHRKQNEGKRDHDRPFGGNADGCFPPSAVNRMNFIMLRADQSRFHLGSVFITPSSLRSGIQNPVFNSLFSASVRCTKASSRFDGGRPLRLSCCNCSISGTLRLICLCKMRLINGDPQ